MTHPFLDPSPALRDAGRGERRYPRLTCDRCYATVGILVPWTRDLNNKRVLMKCCLRCEAEMRGELLP